MDDDLMADIYPLIPLDWELTDGNEPTAGQYGDWVMEVIGDIHSPIWPVYAPGSSTWTQASVGPLLDADFTLLANLRLDMGLPIGAQYPTTVQHGDFFAQEDDLKISFGGGYDRYDPTLPRLAS
jgi:hypothetical protein